MATVSNLVAKFLGDLGQCPSIRFRDAMVQLGHPAAAFARRWSPSAYAIERV